MLKKWSDIIFNHKISLRERMFRVAASICMVALLIILPMGRNLINLGILAISLIGMTLIVKVSIRKECIDAGATAIALLLLLLFPISFFSAGGFYSGMPEWFVLCFVYISITLEGSRKRFFFPALYGGDVLLLLCGLLFPGVCGSEYGRSFIFRFGVFGGAGRTLDQYPDVFAEQAL